MWKKFLSVIFMLSFVLFIWTVPEKKVQAEGNSVRIGKAELNASTPYTDDEKNDATADPVKNGGSRGDSYALYDSSSSTLTLHNFTLQAGTDEETIYTPADLNIVLEGDNSISRTFDNESYGIYAEGHDICISGNGSLNIKAVSNIQSAGIVARNFTINSGSIYVEGQTTGNQGTGIEAENANINGGDIEACGGTAAVGAKNSININAGVIKTPAGGKIGKYMNTATIFDVNGNIAKHVIIGSPDSNGSICDHNYEWMVENEPTEDETGLLVEKCTKCGNIRSSQVIPAIKDDFGRCMYEHTKQILNAKSGQTITVDIGNWDTLPKSFFEALSNKRDITINVKFMYKGKHYEFTIIPGQTIDTSTDYYGPEKLIMLYGAKVVQTK